MLEIFPKWGSAFISNSDISILFLSHIDPSNSLYKCNASLAYHNCCHKDYPCGENEGHCDNDSDCKDGLRCGVRNCGKDWPDSSWNCCTSAPTICNAATANGHCCSEKFPCAENEGDCDNDKECKDGLRCGYNNCGNDWPHISFDCCTSKPLPQVPPSTFKLMVSFTWATILIKYIKN